MGPPGLASLSGIDGTLAETVEVAEFPSAGQGMLQRMKRLRDRAVARKTRELYAGTCQLERISRDQPNVSRLAGEARRSLAAAAFASEPEADCSLTAREDDDLRCRASNGDEAALAEICRRSAAASA